MAPDAQDVAFRRAVENTDVILDCIFGTCATKSDSNLSVPTACRETPRPLIISLNGVPTGFSFKPPARAPFITVLNEFKKTSKPILSVDIPSGWDVEQGNPGDGFQPGTHFQGSLSAQPFRLPRRRRAGDTDDRGVSDRCHHLAHGAKARRQGVRRGRRATPPRRPVRPDVRLSAGMPCSEVLQCTDSIRCHPAPLGPAASWRKSID
jgi:hypothetical protein